MIKEYMGDHILLYHNPGTLGEENEVCTTMNDDGPVTPLDNAG